MKATWLRILGLPAFVALLAVGGGWRIMRGQSRPAPTAPVALPAAVAASIHPVEALRYE